LTQRSEGQAAPTEGGNFDALLADLDSMQKAMATAVIPKSGEGEGEGGEGGGQDGGEGEGGSSGGGTVDDADLEMFGKSLNVTLESGETVRAIDGEAMLKGMTFLRGENTALRDELTVVTGDLAKSYQAIEALTGMCKSMGTAIDGLRGELARVSNTGRGRASSLSVLEKSTGAGSRDAAPPPAGATRKEILAKSMELLGKGLLSGSDVARIEGCLNVGQPVPDHLKQVLEAG
jgi:hypothetical protein